MTTEKTPYAPKSNTKYNTKIPSTTMMPFGRNKPKESNGIKNGRKFLIVVSMEISLSNGFKMQS